MTELKLLFFLGCKGLKVMCVLSNFILYISEALHKKTSLMQRNILNDKS